MSRSIPFKFLLALALLTSSALLATTVPAPLSERERAWTSSESFSLSAAELLAWAGSVPPAEGEDIVVLLEESKFYFEPDGRHRVDHRLVYVTTTQAAAERWGSVSAAWAPWNDERPVIRARVVTAAGAEHQLDKETIEESGMGGTDATIYSDRRVLRAPLPAVGANAVVEQLISQVEKKPQFEAGIVRFYHFNPSVQTRLSRLVVDAPGGLPLKFQTDGTTTEPRRETVGERVVMRMEVGPIPAAEDFEYNTPGDVTQGARIAFSTAASWNSVARRYHEIVEEQLKGNGLAALVKETIGKAKDRDEIIRRLVIRLHKDVRYTGVEFAEASYVPRPPRETLSRRFGDCKDKSALLIAMLREAGIPAHVAVLSTGPGRDVDAALPGFGAFDHAIVFIPGAEPRWIDATDEMGDIGTLPGASQGRLALIAAPDTSTLTLTPETTSGDSRFIGSLEFKLSEYGKANLIESATVAGGFARSLRSGYDRADQKKIREHFENYIKEKYLSEKLTNFKFTDPRDLSKPFEYRIEMSEAQRGMTDLEQAAVGIFPGAVLEDLPGEFLTEEEDEEEGEKKKRKNDYVFAEPFTVIWKYRIEAPDGFRAHPLPETEVVPIGTASVTQEYRQESDRVVVATLKLDSGKRRITASEYEALRKAAVEFRQREVVLVSFQQIGQAHLSNGDVLSALTEFRRLSADHPKEAIHHCQLAMALLEGGLGAESRKEIDVAVKADPASSLAHQLRGWVYQHDLLGRYHKPGWDYDIALASYRKAKELDAKDVDGRAQLAILLEHDAAGRRYSAKSKLAEAITEYEGVLKDLEDESYLPNHAIALLRASRLEELKKFAEEHQSLDKRGELLLVATIGTKGIMGIPALLQKHVPEQQNRSAAMHSVAETFLFLRRYPEAAACYLEAAKGSPQAGLLRSLSDAFRKAQPYEGVANGDDINGTVRKFYIATYSPDATLADLEAFFSKNVREELKDRKFREEFEKEARKTRSLGSIGAVPAETLLDLLLGTLQVALEGDDQIGYRALIRFLWAGQPIDETLFLIKEDGRYVVASPPDSMVGAALQARDLLKAGNITGARKWLDWVRDKVPNRQSDDPLARNPLVAFWRKGEEANEQQAAAAIATLLLPGSEKTREEATRTLADAASQPHPPEEQMNYDAALAMAYAAKYDGEHLLPVSERLHESVPHSDTALGLRSAALLLLKRESEAIALAKKRLEKDASDAFALRVLADATASSGHYEESIEIYRGLIASGKAVANDYNSAAWFALSAPPVTDEAIEHAQQAVNLTSSRLPHYLHTLATLYAERGNISEAKAVIWKSMETSGLDTPEPHDWYVLGRIAEQYGMREAAAAAYAKVEKDVRRPDSALSTWELAQQRLKALGNGKAKRRS